MSFIRFLLLINFACILSTIQASQPPVAFLPQGRWEDKAGSAKLHIGPKNQIFFAFSGDLPRKPCQIQVDGILRTEYYAALECKNIQYSRAIFYFNRETNELELTFIQNRAFFQTYIFVKEGTRKPPPEI